MGCLASLGKVSKPIYLPIHPIPQISQPNRNIHLVNKRVGSQSRSQGTTVPVPVLKLQFSQTEAINFSWAKKSWAGMRAGWPLRASGRASLGLIFHLGLRSVLPLGRTHFSPTLTAMHTHRPLSPPIIMITISGGLTPKRIRPNMAAMRSLSVRSDAVGGGRGELESFRI